MKKSSKILSMTIALVMLFGMLTLVPLTANAAEAESGAGIGGGYNGSGTVAINSGTVTATGTDSGAGIGGEYNDPDPFSP